MKSCEHRTRPAANSSLRRRPSGRHALDQNPLLRAQIQGVGESGPDRTSFRTERRVPHVACRNQIVGSASRSINRNSKPDSSIRAGRRINRAVDPDHLATTVQKRTAGISAVNRCICLNRFVDERILAGLHRAPQRTHHSRRECALKSEGVSDRQHALADQQIARIAQRQRRELFAFRIDLNQRNVVTRVRADVFCLVTRLVAQHHLDRLRSLDHVVIGQDVAVRVDHEPGARAFHRHGIKKEIVLHCARHDIRHCWRSLFVNAHVLRFGGIERDRAFVCHQRSRWPRVYCVGIMRAPPRARPVRAQSNHQPSRQQPDPRSLISSWCHRRAPLPLLRVPLGKSC